MFTLYQGRTAVCAIKVRLVLAEKKLDWTPRDLNLRAGEQHQEEYLKLNPSGVVPTLVHDDRILTESSVIMLYLDELHRQPPLQPEDIWQRAQMRLWMKLVDETLHPGNVTLTYATLHREEMMKRSAEAREAHYARIPNPVTRQRQRQAVEMGLEAPDAVNAVRAFDQALQRMDAALAQHAWLACDSYSLADAAITSYIDRAETLGLSSLWENTRPRVVDWLARIRSRPSYDEAITAFLPNRAAAPASDQVVLSRLSEILRAQS